MLSESRHLRLCAMYTAVQCKVQIVHAGERVHHWFTCFGCDESRFLLHSHGIIAFSIDNDIIHLQLIHTNAAQRNSTTSYRALLFSQLYGPVEILFFKKKKIKRSSNTVCDAIARHKAFTYNSKSDDFTSRAFQATHSNPWLLFFQSNRCIAIPQQRHSQRSMIFSLHQNIKLRKCSSHRREFLQMRRCTMTESSIRLFPNGLLNAHFGGKKSNQTFDVSSQLF